MAIDRTRGIGQPQAVGHERLEVDRVGGDEFGVGADGAGGDQGIGGMGTLAAGGIEQLGGKLRAFLGDRLDATIN